MQLSPNCGYLVFAQDGRKETRTVRIVAEFPEAFSPWTSATRISPIWGVSEFETSPVTSDPLKGDAQIIFLGPCQPARLKADLPDIETKYHSKLHLWITLGAFNVILRSQSKRATNLIIKWAASIGTQYEIWTLKNAHVQKVEYSAEPPTNTSLLSSVQKLAGSKCSIELSSLVAEFCALMASAVTRGCQTLPRAVADLAALQTSVEGICTAAANSNFIPEAQGILTNINAGLSRFTSQAFSGTTPIWATESHFWIHSFLGIGVANWALRTLSTFVFRTLAAGRIPQRIGLLTQLVPGVPDLGAAPTTSEVFFEDHLSKVTLSDTDYAEPLVPPITYFSGRDGFKSHSLTLSAPLATLSACNSLRWSLLTLTHEISHVFVRGALNHLYPDIRKGVDIEHAIKILQSGGLNLLDAARKYLLQAVLSMKNEDDGGEATTKQKLSPTYLKGALEHWRSDVEEIMAHVFDFLYFYRSDHEKYIKGIWLSWGVIPNISNRVPEYVLRTLCGILPRHLRRGDDMQEFARDEVLAVLRSMPDATQSLSYTYQAISHIESNWLVIRRNLIARKPIVRIVNGFPFSNKIAAELWRENIAPGASSGSHGREGYPSKPGTLDEWPIDNPLRFLDV